VAHALTVFAEQKKLAVAVIAEPVSNSVVVAGDPGSHKQVVTLLEAIDKQPPQILAEIMFVEVTTGFTEKIGLKEKDKAEEVWVLTTRETQLLNATLRYAKGSDFLSCLSRPQLMVADNQTGFVEVGGASDKLITRVTPRIIPDGLLVDVATRVEKPNEETDRRTTAKLPDGGTLVMRGAKTGESEILVILTVHVIVK
jgi:hypothetical protein